VEPPAEEIAVDESFTITASNYKDKMKTIKLDGKKYAPTNSKDIFVRVDLEYTNTTDQKLEFPVQYAIELACLTETNEVVFALPQATDIFDGDIQDYFKKNYIESKKSKKKTLYFLRNKKHTPIAVTVDRKNVLLIKKETPELPTLMDELTHLEKIENLMNLAKDSDYETIESYCAANDLSLGVLDYKGYSLLDYSIVFHNNDLINELMTHAIPIDYEIYRTTSKDSPLKLAVLANNPEAIRILVQNGENLNESFGQKDTPVQLALRENKVNLLPLFVELGIDFKNVTVNLIGGGDYDPLRFAQNRKFTEMIDFFTQYYEEHNLE
jgi:hypothetical protein